ncbi:MAG: AmmeMemoRadiSam system radical SAM enzyme [DPANN group archaeon]|nr:AmmeMemoRadiSam system radical SAM enzyme [DPANN group archaeon]
MKKAMFFKSIEGSRVQCQLCPNNCIISEGGIGSCRVRKKVDGILYSLNYGKIVSLAVDPIEKKPLYHFYPGSESLSIATVGCNFHCKFCQNWEISQSSFIFGEDMTPQDVVNLALLKGVKSISYTYTEPTIFFEFAYDTAKLAHSCGIQNVFVTNGFINSLPFKKIVPYLDAVNIDLKSFNDIFYQKLCSVRGVSPVLDTIQLAYGLGIHIELTNLLIPGWNTSSVQIKALCEWVYALDKRIPLHFSRYFPAYKMTVESTPVAVLESAYGIAKKVGLEYVYVGNVVNGVQETYCPSCGELLVDRGRRVEPLQKLIKGACPKCKYKVYGVGLL